MYLRIYVSRVLDRQLLNGWCHDHENGRVCSRTRSHESVICFRILWINIFSSYGEFKMRENKLRVKIPATAESSRSSGQSIILR